MVPQLDANAHPAVTAGAPCEESAPLDVPHDTPETPTAPSPVPASQELVTNVPDEAVEAEMAAESQGQDVSVPPDDPSNLSKTGSASSKHECEDLNKTFDVSSDGSTGNTGSGNDDGWDENHPVKKIDEAKSRSEKRVFHRRLLCVGAVAVGILPHMLRLKHFAVHHAARSSGRHQHHSTQGWHVVILRRRRSRRHGRCQTI